MNNKFFLTLVYIFLTTLCAIGQKQKITIEQKVLKFEQFTQILQSEHQISVFYMDKWVEDIVIDKTFKDKSLEEIFQEILSPYSINFIVRDNTVILTKSIELSNEFGLQTNKKDIAEQLAPNKEKTSNGSNFHKEQEYIIHNIGTSAGQKNVTLYGYVNHLESELPLSGVEVFLPNLKKGVTTSKTGYYEISIKPGHYTVIFKHLGLRETSRKMNLRGHGQLDVKMLNEVREIREVNITAAQNRIKSVSMGVEKIEMEDIKNLPSALGEPDIIKSATMLAGVESAGEGTIGFNVRGGSADQNLILIDNAPIYYPAHFFGFFAAFNNDMIENAQLYKASIPSEFGGRISSVYDIHTKTKISPKFNGKVGISPITTKTYFELPLIKDKLSFSNSFRFTYSDWILNLIDSEELNNSKAGFQDLHGKLLYKPDRNNKISLSYYYSNDDFQLHSDSTYNFKNLIGSVNWQHRFSDNKKIISNAYMSNYSYELETDEIALNAFTLKHKVSEIGGKSQLIIESDLISKINIGTEAKKYNIDPGKLTKSSDKSIIENFELDSEKGVELALFGGLKFRPLSRLTTEIGLRYSLFGNLGDRMQSIYQNNKPETKNVIDSVATIGLNNIYHGPEYRINLSYELSGNSSLKMSYNRSRQNIHLLTNTTAISPVDTWRLTSKYLKPQIGDQYSVGFYKQLFNNKVEFSLETYYKKIKDAKDYKDAAQLYLKRNIETEVINVDGKSYGLEFMARKKTGRFNGIISYSYSRSFFKTDNKKGPFSINDGEYYRAPFDKPHNLKTMFTYKLSRRLILSSNSVFNMGKPATYPIAQYHLQGTPISYYSKRNAYRIPNYFRTDLSLQVIGNLKKDKTFHSSVTLGIYNLTGRKNTYSVYFRSTNNGNLGYKLSIFGQAIPMISYNLEF